MTVKEKFELRNKNVIRFITFFLHFFSNLLTCFCYCVFMNISKPLLALGSVLLLVVGLIGGVVYSNFNNQNQAGISSVVPGVGGGTTMVGSPSPTESPTPTPSTSLDY